MAKGVKREELVFVSPDEVIEGERYREKLGNLTTLKESITEKGLIQPITVTKDMVLVAGGRRLAACKELELKKIPVIKRTVVDELDLREVELYENIYRKDLDWPERARLEKAIFDFRQGDDKKWSNYKQAEERDVTHGTIQRRRALAEVLDAIPELGECKSEDEAWKMYKRFEEDVYVKHLEDTSAAKYKDAAKWAEDHYKIGDALVGLDNINPKTVNFIEVDPPYAIDLGKRKERSGDQRLMSGYNEVAAADYGTFCHSIAENSYRILKDNSFMLWWFGIEWHSTVLDILQEVGFKVNAIPSIWYKGPSGQTASPDTMLASSYEPFFVCRKGEPKLRKPGRSNVFHFTPVAPQKKIHPTERPMELMDEIMDTFLYPGSITCIPFLGSGNTLRAVYRSGGVGYGWDLDEMYKGRFVQRVFLDTGVEQGDDDEQAV